MATPQDPPTSRAPTFPHDGRGPKSLIAKAHPAHMTEHLLSTLGATGVCRSLIQTAESPGGACWSSTRSATSWSLRPDWCRDVEAAALACEVRATTNIPCNLASTAT